MVARDDYAQVFGARLRELRTAAGLSQRDLASLVGTSSAAISNLEAGNNAQTLGTLVKLADALGCRVVELVKVLDGKSPRPRKR